MKLLNVSEPQLFLLYNDVSIPTLGSGVRKYRAQHTVISSVNNDLLLLLLPFLYAGSPCFSKIVCHLHTVDTITAIGGNLVQFEEPEKSPAAPNTPLTSLVNGAWNSHLWS